MTEALEGLDYRFVLLKGLRSAEITSREVAIVQTFEEATEDEVNYLITNVNLSLLFYKMKDRDVMTWKAATLLSRTRIIHLLCITKLPLLHTAARRLAHRCADEPATESTPAGRGVGVQHNCQHTRPRTDETEDGV